MSLRAGSEGTYRYRLVFVVVETVIAFGALAGTVQLIAEKGTPPVSDLDALGLSSWTLPGIWLFVSVAVPSTAAAWLAWRRSAYTPVAVLIASGALIVELAVQIPFIGLSPFQFVFGTAAVTMAVLATRAQVGRTWSPESL